MTMQDMTMQDTTEQETLCPAEMVWEATPETAPRVASQLNRMLMDPNMPEPMRDDIRSRLSDLGRRFEAELLGEVEPKHSDLG
jgi:hypothetical protein